jgi:hypothetical protein
MKANISSVRLVNLHQKTKRLAPEAHSSTYVPHTESRLQKVGEFVNTHNYCRALVKFLFHKLEFIIIKITMIRTMRCLKGRNDMISIQFTHQQMHLLLNLKEFKIYIKIHFCVVCCAEWDWLSLILHSTRHTHHSVSFCTAHNTHATQSHSAQHTTHTPLKHMLPHHHITYKDIILPSVLT